MKYFVAIALLVAVASAAVFRPTPVNHEIEEIIAAINSPSTDPATAVALEAMLYDVLGLTPPSVGPAIVPVDLSPISVGPAFIDFPIHDGGALTNVDDAPIAPIAVVEPAVVEPSPVVVGENPAGSSSLVQIIVNVNQAESSVPAPAPGPVVIPAPVVVPEVVEEVYVPGPVNIVEDVDVAPVSPIQVVNPVIPSPIQVVNPVFPEPIQVVNPVIVEPVQVVNPVFPEPIVIEPVQVGTPIIPSPVIIIPEELN